MGIAKVLSFQTQSKLVIPCAGKMFYSSIKGEKQALCFVLNKGYIETTSLNSMLSTLDACDRKTIIKVGNIDKIHLRKLDKYVYRQRLYFKSITEILSICKRYGIKFELAHNFKITINNIMNVIDNLGKLEHFAKGFDETIDTWLTNCCIVHIHCLLSSLSMASDLEPRVKQILNKRNGYMDYSPFLISSYDIKKHTSSVYIEPESVILDGMFSKPLYENNNLSMGFTTDNINKYRKGHKTDESTN